MFQKIVVRQKFCKKIFLVTNGPKSIFFVFSLFCDVFEGFRGLCRAWSTSGCVSAMSGTAKSQKIFEIFWGSKLVTSGAKAVFCSFSVNFTMFLKGFEGSTERGPHAIVVSVMKGFSIFVRIFWGVQIGHY